eukprot:scaffold294941_cov41-Prasinocladus_malaysianus.AAC.1
MQHGKSWPDMNDGIHRGRKYHALESLQRKQRWDSSSANDHLLDEMGDPARDDAAELQQLGRL